MQKLERRQTWSFSQLRLELQLCEWQPLLSPLPHSLCPIHKSPSTGPSHPAPRAGGKLARGLPPLRYNNIGKPFNSPTSLLTTRPFLWAPTSLLTTRKCFSQNIKLNRNCRVGIIKGTLRCWL